MNVVVLVIVVWLAASAVVAVAWTAACEFTYRRFLRRYEQQR